MLSSNAPLYISILLFFLAHFLARKRSRHTIVAPALTRMMLRIRSEAFPWIATHPKMLPIEAKRNAGGIKKRAVDQIKVEKAIEVTPKK